jgi:WD40 repeat protein
MGSRVSPRPALIGVGLCLLGAVSAGGLQAAPPPPVWAVAFSPDGKLLATGGYRDVRLWDVAGRAPLRTLGGHVGPVRCLAWSADGTQIAAGGGLPGEAGDVKVWRAPFEPGAAPLKPAAETREHKDVVEGVAFATGGDAVLSAGVDEKALAVKLEPRKVVGSMQDHTSRVTAVAVSPSGKYVATGSLDKTVKIWAAADYKPLANVDTGAPIQALAFLPGPDAFAVALEDGATRLYRLSEGRSGGQATVNLNLIRTLNGNRTPLFALAVAPRGNLLATGGQERVVNVYDLNNGNRRHLLKESPEHIYSLAFSPDGALLAAGCRDGKVRLWTTTDGKPAGEL